MRASFECAIQKYHTPFIIGDDGIFDRMPVCHYNAFFVSDYFCVENVFSQLHQSKCLVG
jgi:hypothetical protein